MPSETLRATALSLSPLSTLSPSSTLQSEPEDDTFLQALAAQSVRYSQLPYILVPPTLPPLSPAARKRIENIKQRCLANDGRNEPRVFLASCRTWRGELPFGWPDEQAAKRRDEDVLVMQWKHALPVDAAQLEVWRAEWRESRKSENRSTFGAPLRKTKLQAGRSMPEIKQQQLHGTSAAVPQSLPVPTGPTAESSRSSDRTITSTTSPKKRAKNLQSDSRTPVSSLTLSDPGTSHTLAIVAALRSSSQQQLLSFPISKPSPHGRIMSKQSASFAGFEVEVEVERSFDNAVGEADEGPKLKRSWSDMGDMTVFQDFLPPSFPSNLAQSTPPPKNKKRRPEEIKSRSQTENESCSRSPSPLPMWGADGTQSALDGVDAAADDVVAMMALEGEECERGMLGEI